MYPQSTPTLEGDAVTIHRFLKDPTLVQRRVNELQAQQWLADFLFPERIEINGAVLYEIGEGLFLNREPEAINPGGEYPRGLPTEGQAAIAKISKWGIDTPITDEKIGRSKRRELDRGLTQVGLTVRRKVDTTAVAVAGAAVTKTQPATAPWTGEGAKAWLDIELAAASIDEEDKGYEADTVIVRPTIYAHLAYHLLPSLPRESGGSTLYTGTLPVISGMLVAPGRLPAGTDALVVDRKAFGFLGYERIPSPEYEGDPATGVETWARRDPDANDQWLVRGRRPVVPVVDSPDAARRITGVAS